jgi:hypothetical protein
VVVEEDSQVVLYREERVEQVNYQSISTLEVVEAVEVDTLVEVVVEVVMTLVVRQELLLVAAVDLVT